MTTDKVIVILVLAVAGVAGAVAAESVGLDYNSDLIIRAGELAAGLFVIALFIERTAAFLIGLWNGEKTEEKETALRSAGRELRSLRRLIDRAEPAHNAAVVLVPTDPDLRVAIVAATTTEAARLTAMRSEEVTRSDAVDVAAAILATHEDKIARQKQVVGLALALVATAAGVRSLHALVPFDEDTFGLARYLFMLADIVITAGLIAGGSAGISKLTELLGKYVKAAEVNDVPTN